MVQALARYGFILMLFISSFAHAEGLKPLHQPQDMSVLESYAKRSEAVSVTFEEDATLSFTVDMPNNWVQRPFISLKNFSRRNRLHGDLAIFDGVASGDMRSTFQVRSIELPREISAKNWLMTYLISSGYTLYSLEEGVDKRSFEAMYIRFEGDQRQGFVIRAKGLISGPRLILGEYIMPTGLWEAERDQQAFVIGSFEVSAEDQDWIEEKEFFTYLEALEFEYPDTWALADKDDQARNILKVSLQNNDFTRVSEGQIRVVVASETSIKDFTSLDRFEIDLPALVGEARELIEADGYMIEAKKGRVDVATGHDFRVNRTEIYPLRARITQYDTGMQADLTHELWLTLLIEEGRAIIATLFTPARDQDLYSWAVNTRAYERVLESLR